MARRDQGGRGAVRGRARRSPTDRPRPAAAPEESLAGFQARIEAIYGKRDRARGLAATFMWFAEEVGELSRALRARDRRALRGEFADVLAWLVTLASIARVDLAQAARKYARGCPRCLRTPCACTRRAHEHRS